MQRMCPRLLLGNLGMYRQIMVNKSEEDHLHIYISKFIINCGKFCYIYWRYVLHTYALCTNNHTCQMMMFIAKLINFHIQVMNDPLYFVVSLGKKERAIKQDLPWLKKLSKRHA